MIYIGILFLFGGIYLYGKCIGKKGVSETITYFLIRHKTLNLSKAERERFTQNLQKALWVVFAGDLLALLLFVATPNNSPFVIGSSSKIARNKAGEGAKSITLFARTEDGEKRQLAFSIEEQSYSQKELEDLFLSMKKEIEPLVLQENTSFKEIKGDLHLPDAVEGYPFSLSYDFDTPGYFNVDGTLLLSESVKLPANVLITMHAVYRDFQKDLVIPVRRVPGDNKKDFWVEVEEAVEEAKSVGGEEVVLPESVAGKKIKWQSTEQNDASMVLILSIAAGILLWFGAGYDEKQKQTERVRVMEEEYGTILSKFTMYLTAGVSIAKTWEIIATKGGENPVYKEMLYCKREIESGVMKEQAYDNFSVRTASKRYARLITLLVQGSNKGNTMLLAQLNEERKNSFEEMRADKKRKGEEATTKLLLPMIVMMAMIMVMIMFPAFSMI